LKFKYPTLQVALDFIDISDALHIASIAWRNGVTWLEIGTPLIKSKGVDVIRVFRERFRDAVLIADMKCIDAGGVEVSLAADAGADIVTVLGVAHDSTILEALDSASQRDVKIMIDLINVSNPIERAQEIERLGVDFICLHTGVDVQKRRGLTVMEELLSILLKVKRSIRIPVAVAGGINLSNAKMMIDAGAQILIIGSAITKSDNPEFIVRKFMELI